MNDARNNQGKNDPLLYFWAVGDLHYRNHEQWIAFHAPRMERMFSDMWAVWREEGLPDFCVSPGDLVDTGAPDNYVLAKQEIAAHLGSVPFYPGIGNHEYHPSNFPLLGREEGAHTADEYIATWDKPLLYSWTAGKDDGVACIMLDQPPPYYLVDGEESNPNVTLSQETLAFLDASLSEHAQRVAIVFAHSPLRDTVLDRDPIANLDDDSQDPFFFIDNSPEMREILARHQNAVLFISGHTHSGWGSPQLVFTEQLGGHAVTHLNVMSPWYTGLRAGPSLNEELMKLEYTPDTPDPLVSFAVSVYRDKAVIRARGHHERVWLQQWEVPLS